MIWHNETYFPVINTNSLLCQVFDLSILGELLVPLTLTTPKIKILTVMISFYKTF